MNNKVYYGEYSLEHWIELILKKNIVLPDYQRYFVWDENKVEILLNTFTKKQFVPPITIGAFKKDSTNQNLILDGQQRLTSIILGYLNIFPDKTEYRKNLQRFAEENDELEEDDRDQMDNVLEWTFSTLVEKGKTKSEILERMDSRSYKSLNLQFTDAFFKKNFLGFSYLVPEVSDEKVQQKYYSSVFRNINIQGQALLP